MRFLALIDLSARMHLVVQWVVLLFLPAMRELTPVLMLAPICICLNEVLRLPLRTLLLLILKDMRLSSEVLPVMSVDTGIPGVVCIAVRAPNSLEVEHVEVRIHLEFAQQIHCHLLLSMSECTHVSIVTRLNLVRIRGAELDFVLLWMIELLDSVVRP